jgi:hypothetical protein
MANVVDAPVVVVIPGPLQLYVGVPVPPASVAVRVIAPPEQRLLDDAVTVLIVGCALTVNVAVAVLLQALVTPVTV